MSILIKGMKMPTNCERCPFLDYEEGFCFASGVRGKSGWYESALCPGEIKGRRHDDCPLVPIPPHGRLIDADNISAKFVEVAGDKDQSAYMIGWNTAIDAVIENAPTIIPADQAEEE